VAGNGDRKLRWKTIQLKEEVNQVCHMEIADRVQDGHIAVAAIVMSDSKEPPPAVDRTLAALSQPDLNLPQHPFGLVAYEDNPHNLNVHVRGSHFALGEEVPRRFLQVLDTKSAFAYSEGSGRLALARTMTDAANPLVARVMVNRIWQHHFGEGIVRTVDNFGRTGARPTHPELLDYLARRFVEDGWSIKKMHKLMVLSDTYQRASGHSDADPQNRWLSHMPVRRLDAESIRDAILAVAGTLDRTIYGKPVGPHISEFQDGRGKPESGPLDGKGRRSVYIEIRRNFLPPMLLAFDCPLPVTTNGRRSVSSVPSQALTLMNNEFVAQQAVKFAQNARTLEEMYLRAFARSPEAAERERIGKFLATQGSMEDVAHVIFNAKEFIFVR
jgi:hypothetical protein